MVAEPDPFPNYTQLPRRVPYWVWDVTRMLSVAAVLFVIWLLVDSPKDGLKLWWGLLVPCLPLLWFVVPGLWRNLSTRSGQSATKANELDLRTNRAGMVDGVCARAWHARFTCGRFIATCCVQLERLGDRNLNRRRTSIGALWGRGF